MIKPSRAQVWAIALCLLGGGCQEPSTAVGVAGKVTVGGAPLSGGAINFFPRGGGRPTGGVLDNAGEYRVELEPNQYTIVVQVSTQIPEGWEEGDPLPPPEVRVPQRYSHPRRSPLKLEVRSGDDVEKDFAIE